jgi:hypothetical protein
VGKGAHAPCPPSRGECRWWARFGFAHSTFLAFLAMTLDMEITAPNFARRANQPKCCPAPPAKINCFAATPNHPYNPRHPAPAKRGVSRSSRTLGAGCGGRALAEQTNGVARTVKSCGSDIPTLISSRPRCFRIVACDGGKKARSPGRVRSKPLKPSRRECRANPAATAVTTLVCFFIFAREAAGAAKRPAFPAPSHFGRSGFASARAHRAARSRSHGCDVAV